MSVTPEWIQKEAAWIAGRLFRKQVDREDFAQEGILKGLQTLQRRPEMAAHKSWMRTVVLNAILDASQVYYHHPRGVDTTLPLEPDGAWSVCDGGINTDALALRTVLSDTLNEADLFDLMAIESGGYNTEELAAMTGRTANAVRSKLCRIRGKLKSAFSIPDDFQWSRGSNGGFASDPRQAVAA